ncbi:hypothetical protein N7462_001882 [Penicillium macrosclerotiorum]|uniref:uncharacterized protein n=1 Tax=Penicillium macrosclerotiorum TaxID=303699 RepID=UPI002546755F|nr:uncharacterized protein N7462_001882 [Penicillium macrosclerotiorum]KAJ5692459.1 hypothetical protein N7462_001882 [Penicillium macrosclerotiorum]
MPADKNFKVKQPFTRWWPLSFMIAAIILFITGGVLIGTWLSHTSNCADDFVTDYNETWDEYTQCYSRKNGQFYGGVICVIIGAVFKLIAWVLLIVHCMQRRRYRQDQMNAQYYHAVPLTDTMQQPYNSSAPYDHQPYYPPPATQYAAQLPSGYYRSTDASAAPMYPNTTYQTPSTNDIHPPKESSPVAHYA